MFGNFTKEEKEKWEKINGDKRSDSPNKIYTFILWVILIFSFMNGISASSAAQSAIHQIYGAISFLIATIVFCTIAMMAKIDYLKG